MGKREGGAMTFINTKYKKTCRSNEFRSHSSWKQESFSMDCHVSTIDLLVVDTVEVLFIAMYMFRLINTGHSTGEMAERSKASD